MNTENIRFPEPIAQILRAWVGRALEHEEHVRSSAHNEAAELLAVLCYGSQAETPHIENVIREILHPLGRARMLSVLDAKRAGLPVVAFVEAEFQQRGKLDCIRWFQRAQQQHWALQRLTALAGNQAPQNKDAAAVARELLAALAGGGNIPPLDRLPDDARRDAIRLIDTLYSSEYDHPDGGGVTKSRIRTTCKYVGAEPPDLGAAASLVTDDRG